MTINQALKQKNRLAGEIAKLNSKILSYNRWVKGNKPDYDSHALYNKRDNLVAELIELRTNIALASAPQVKNMILLAELKAKMQLLERLPTNAGIEPGYSENHLVYEVQMPETQKDMFLEGVQQDINNIQDALDHFNATTHI